VLHGDVLPELVEQLSALAFDDRPHQEDELVDHPSGEQGLNERRAPEQQEVLPRRAPQSRQLLCDQRVAVDQ
jgi:hypothetical protein